jgi:hypothetical protein
MVIWELPLLNCFQAYWSVSSAARRPQVWVDWFPASLEIVLVTSQAMSFV